MKHLLIILAAALVIALPFIFRQESDSGDWQAGNPELVVISPHNEAIRRTFGDAFSRWHNQKYGEPVRIDWRSVGGTTEIMRYLSAEYSSSAKLYFCRKNGGWPVDGTSTVLARRVPEDPDKLVLWKAFRAVDDPSCISSGIDVFFGGGVYDHNKAARQGLSVPAWKTGEIPTGIFEDKKGRSLIPESVNGEQWRSDTFYGSALSTFGICFNIDRLKDLGIDKPPVSWDDLADPRYMGQLGLTDPTKSGSVAKTFEMIIHTLSARRVASSGYSREQIAGYENQISAAKLPMGVMPPSVPEKYQQAVEQGWLDGVQLLRRLGAQARYFTVSSDKVPVDVSLGFVAAGVCIDFYGRYQSEISKLPDGKPVMQYITPVGGSSVTADPISLLRGARRRELAVRFITYVLSSEGQKLWNYRMGEPGGPTDFSLRRLPIRRDFYPSDDPEFQAAFNQHKPHYTDELWRRDVDAYQLSEAFFYNFRWTGRHFGIQRDLVKAMCLDSADELRKAWKAILENGGPEANPEAMQAFEALPGKPYPVTWKDAVTTCSSANRLDLLREWTAFFRSQYRMAAKLARRRGE